MTERLVHPDPNKLHRLIAKIDAGIAWSKEETREFGVLCRDWLYIYSTNPVALKELKRTRVKYLKRNQKLWQEKNTRTAPCAKKRAPSLTNTAGTATNRRASLPGHW